jgi:hypothetical protein
MVSTSFKGNVGDPVGGMLALWDRSSACMSSVTFEGNTAGPSKDSCANFAVGGAAILGAGAFSGHKLSFIGNVALSQGYRFPVNNVILTTGGGLLTDMTLDTPATVTAATKDNSDYVVADDGPITMCKSSFLKSESESELPSAHPW